MSYLVENAEDRFSRDEAHMLSVTIFKYRSNFGEVDVAPLKNDKVNKVEK